MKRHLALLLLFSVVASLGMAGEWGLLDPTPYSGPAPAGPAHASRFFVVTVPAAEGTAEVSLPLTDPKGALVVVIGDRPSRALALGRELKRQRFAEPELEAMDIAPEGVRIDVSSLPPGEHRLRLDGLARPVVQVAVAEPESPLELTVQVKPLAVRSGEEVIVTARLADEVPLTQAQVVARLATGASVALRDDGQAPDAQAGDGVFTGSFRAPAATGMSPVELRVEAFGRRGNGQPFVRMAPAAVMVTEPASGIAGGRVEASPEALTVQLVPASGRFRVEAIYAADGTSFAWAQEEVTMNGQAAAVTLPRPRETWGADRVLVRLLNLDTLGVETEVETQLVPLAAPPDFRATAQAAPQLPPSKAEAARRFGDRKP